MDNYENYLDEYQTLMMWYRRALLRMKKLEYKIHIIIQYHQQIPDFNIFEFIENIITIKVKLLRNNNADMITLWTMKNEFEKLNKRIKYIYKLIYQDKKCILRN